ncbi:zinc/iron-chelating domain-containing protein [Thermodesulfomicrobium sp. WS]|uniref:YkgJ family cysteine cluster protein n=1 Tax=Thermodesulfomicrobium sp. WS TaxID=3004129 RepID=UPI00249355E7|nr:YkgJ family cysteine cluster protein [Thermodesulfomicrobium sp. WS]BDV00844.1 zinc/iron-chelating domain-containing protein [Thermodesulfomicrobium sp. WS]
MRCLRCGTCCRKNGPTLRVQDRELLRSGAILVGDLVCVRRGELAWDPRTRALQSVAGEMLKIRGQGSGWTCLYYDAERRACTRYAVRPVECRVLSCADPGPLLAVMNEAPLTRDAIIRPESALALIVQEHEAIYSAGQAVEWAQNPTTLALAHDLARREAQFRAVLAERLAVDDAALWPYLGRPLTQIVEAVRQIRRLR